MFCWQITTTEPATIELRAELAVELLRM